MTRDRPTDSAPRYRPQTLLVRGGLRRSAFDETSEGLYLTSGYVYGSPEEAERTIRALGVAYVVLCGGLPSPTEKLPASLRARLTRGEAIGFLAEVAPAPGKPIRVWRVLP